jgi:hypothetical protein
MGKSPTTGNAFPGAGHGVTRTWKHQFQVRVTGWPAPTNRLKTENVDALKSSK